MASYLVIFKEILNRVNYHIIVLNSSHVVGFRIFSCVKKRYILRFLIGAIMQDSSKRERRNVADKFSSLIYNLGTLSTLLDNYIHFQISLHI